MGGVLPCLVNWASTRDSELSTPVPTKQPASPTDSDLNTTTTNHPVATPPVGEAEEPLKTSEPHLSRILALTPVPSIVLDPKLDIVEVSKSYLCLATTTLEDCIGFNISKYILDKNPSADFLSVRRAIKTAIVSKEVNTIDDIYIAPSKYWHARVVPIFDGDELIFVVFEVEEYIASRASPVAHDDLAYSNEMYRLLVNNVKDYAIFMLDTRGYIATWNAGASILKQYSSEEIIGQHFSIFYSDEDKAAKKPQKELEICLREGRVEDEGWRYKKDGTKFWASVVIAPAYRDDQHIGFCKVTRDLTERKAGEARLIAAFEEASKLKSEFLANMSHEIRTPMHGMLAAGVLLMDTDLTDEQKEIAQIIEESGSILLQVINDILDYSKLASGTFSIVPTNISVQEIISSVVRASKTTLQPGVLIDIEPNGSVPKDVESDPLRFRQVLQNIVSNAIKFTEQGSIRISTKVSEEDETSYTLLTEVADTGIGVPSSAVGALFTPFAQFDSSATKRFKGAGLGLSICKSLVELMGGSIGFRPNQARGSIFWFTMELTKTTKRPLVSLLTQQPNTKLTDTALAKQILIVEDNRINQTIMVKLLKGSGFKHIKVASNGKEGFELVQSAPLAYSLILMDISMPVMDGITATEMIRGMGLDIPIIAMTANVLKGDEESYLASGLNDYVAKPVDRKILLRILAKWLEY